MALTYTTDFKGQASGVSATITSNTITANTGDFITIAACYDDDAKSTAWTVSNTGTAITWTKQIETSASQNCKVVMWSGTAGVTPPTTVSVQSTAGAAITGSKALFTAIHTGAHTVTPLPAGNLFSGTGGTDVTQAITPSSSGSALWMLAGDWSQTNSFAAAASCTLAATVYNEAGQQTVVPIQPTTNPRTDAASFTIGESDTAGKIAWAAWDVQANFNISSYNPRRLNTRDLNKTGFRSNVLRRGNIAWRESVYRDLNPQATNPALPHVTSGDLTGQGSTIVGSAEHKAKHTTTGVLTGPGSAIVGAAAHKVKHPTTGVLTGQASSIVGSAAHKAKHTTTGVLAGLVSTIAGVARRFRSHPTTGVLTGQGSSIVGSAAHKAKHTTTGVLTGPGSIIVGAARRFITHVTSGVLIGQGSVIVGSASRAAGSVTHVTTGVLTGQSSSIVGSAVHKAKHTTTGALIGQLSIIAGTATHKLKHTTAGVLTGHSTIIAGSSEHKIKHATNGALVGQLSVVVGSAVHNIKHATTGALIGFGALVTGIATNGTSVITKRFGVAYWKPVEKEEPIPEEDIGVWTEPDLFEKLRETRANHEAIIKKAQQAELMDEQQQIRLRKIQDDQIIEMYLRSKR